MLKRLRAPCAGVCGLRLAGCILLDTTSPWRQLLGAGLLLAGYQKKTCWKLGTCISRTLRAYFQAIASEKHTIQIISIVEARVIASFEGQFDRKPCIPVHLCMYRSDNLNCDIIDRCNARTCMILWILHDF